MALRIGHVAALALVLPAVLAPVDIAAAQQPLTGYSLASWAERDGVPLGPVRALAQDQDGYLWLGTDAGLLRFDGLRFLTAAELGLAGLPARDVHALLAATTGMVWVGLTDGRGLHAIDGDVAVPAPLPDGASVTSLAEDAAGDIWVATSLGLYRGTLDGFSRVDPRDATFGTVREVHVDRQARLWVGASLGLFEHTGGTSFRRVPGAPGTVRGVSVRDGAVWITHPTRGFMLVGNDLTADHAFEGVGLSLLHDSRDNLWVTTRGQGLWRVYPDALTGETITERASVATGLMSDGIWAVHEDRDGNLWVGTHEGLHRLMPHEATPITDLGLVHAVAARGHDRIWVGTASGLIRATRGALDRLEVEQILSGHDVRAIAPSENGGVWAATPGGLARVDADGRAALLAMPGGAAHDVRSLALDAAGTLWAADARTGLLRVDGNTPTPVRLEDHARPTGVTLVHVDRAGALWLALADGRLARRDPSGTLHYATGTSGGTIHAVAEDGHGDLWVGTSDGLGRLRDGRLDMLPGLGRVTALAFDAHGGVWAAVQRAIVHLDRAQVDRALADPSVSPMYRRLTTAHGTAGVPITGGGSMVATTSDGVLWFVTGRGLTVVDPEAIDLTPRPFNSRVYVESVTADGSRLAAAGDTVTVPAGTSRLQIDYTTLQLSRSTTPRFRYQLEGFDAGWVDAGTQRQTVFTNLRPGQYRFLVQALGEDLSWTPAPSVLTLAVQPAPYQRPVFFVVLALGLAGLGWAAWTARLRIVEHRFSLALAERARLSREMHDTLLQSLVGFALQLDSVASDSPSSSETRSRLFRMRKQVERHIREVRQSIWDLRSPTIGSDDLAAALGDAGDRLTDGRARFRFSVRGARRRLDPGRERHLLRIGQEAITNAVRHGAATQVMAELCYRDREVVLRVRDNGRGFDPSVAEDTSPHYGILSMRERAMEAGGTCEILSSPTHGTTVEVRVPAA